MSQGFIHESETKWFSCVNTDEELCFSRRVEQYSGTHQPSLTHSNSMTSTAFAFKSPLYGITHLLLTGPYVLIYFKLETDISKSDCLCPILSAFAFYGRTSFLD